MEKSGKKIFVCKCIRPYKLIKPTDHFRGRLLWLQKSHRANVAADDLMQSLCVLNALVKLGMKYGDGT